MFPLGSVLLPGMILPLQVFEERYRALMRDCMAGDRRFGVTLIERGSEVGGGDIRAMVGTMAQIVQADEMPDGRWGVIALGSHRIRVTGWLPDDPYPQAEVEEWPDVRSADPEAAVVSYQGRVAQLRRVLALAVELGADADPMLELADDVEIGTFQIGVLSPIGALDRQRVLAAPGVDQRLLLLEELLDDQELMLQARVADL
jgi:hypothetical protein